MKTPLIFTSNGFYENGRWITPQFLMAEQTKNIPQPKFELITHEAIPVFKMGACTGYKDEKVSMGIFTQAQIKEILPSNDLNTELMNRTEIVPI